MAIATNAPGVQLYTSNFLDGSLAGKGGARYPKYAGVCLETQNFPDAIHHLPTADRGGFPSPVLRPGETYLHTTIYSFSADIEVDIQTIPGLPPDLSYLPSGCAFRARQTPDRQALCLTDRQPPLQEIAPGHWVQACPGCVEGGLPL